MLQLLRLHKAGSSIKDSPLTGPNAWTGRQRPWGRAALEHEWGALRARLLSVLRLVCIVQSRLTCASSARTLLFATVHLAVSYRFLCHYSFHDEIRRFSRIAGRWLPAGARAERDPPAPAWFGRHHAVSTASGLLTVSEDLTSSHLTYLPNSSNVISSSKLS